MLKKSHPTFQFSVYGLLSNLYIFATIKLLSILLSWDTFDIN